MRVRCDDDFPYHLLYGHCFYIRSSLDSLVIVGLKFSVWPLRRLHTMKPGEVVGISLAAVAATVFATFVALWFVKPEYIKRLKLWISQKTHQCSHQREDQATIVPETIGDDNFAVSTDHRCAKLLATTWHRF